MTGNTAIIPNGAPVVAVSPPTTDAAHTGRGFAMTAGALLPVKGIDVLIKAISLLRRRGFDQRLMIVGSGDEQVSLAALAKDEHVDDLIVFTGMKPHSEVLALMAQSEFFVLASRAEGMPLVVLEAMMCARAVVATNVGGVPEIVADGRTGLLVAPESSAQLADAMHRVAQDRELREQLGRAGHLVARAYRWSDVAARYLELMGLRDPAQADIDREVAAMSAHASDAGAGRA
jgi:glycosyltransferase involved in cell wall biosynthesis